MSLTDKLAVYTSRDLAEAYGETTRNLANTVVEGAVLTLPADARETLNDGAETVYIVRARDDEGVVDLAVKFVAHRVGVSFWDELDAEQQAGPYLSMGIDYEKLARAEALMTAEIVLTDHDVVFVFGGPVDQAEAMAADLAQRLNLAPPAAGSRLRVAMSRAEMVPITEWIKDTFPQIGFVTRPRPLRAAKCPWRLFRLAADADMRDALDDDTLIKTIAIVVDGLFEQHTKWGFESDAVIGSVVADRDPLLRITVNPAAQVVFVAELPPGTELPEKLSPTPYGDQPHH